MQTHHVKKFTPAKSFIQKFASISQEYQLKDGTTVLIDKLAVGGLCMSPGNPPVPLAAGDYELQDGTKFIIMDGGLITKIENISIKAGRFKQVKNLSDILSKRGR